MPQLVQDKRDLTRETNILRNKEVEDRIFDILQSSPNLSETEALEIALKIQKAVRGEASMLDNMDNPQIADEYRRLRDKAEKRDKANLRFEQDQTTYVNDVAAQAEKTLQGQNVEELRKKGLNMFKQYKAFAKNMKQDDIIRELEAQPKIRVKVIGRKVNKKVGGRIKEVEVPEIVTYKGINISLYPGEREIPISLAQLYKQREQDRQDIEDVKNIYRPDANGDMPDFHTVERSLREKL